MVADERSKLEATDGNIYVLLFEFFSGFACWSVFKLQLERFWPSTQVCRVVLSAACMRLFWYMVLEFTHVFQKKIKKCKHNYLPLWSIGLIVLQCLLGTKPGRWRIWTIVILHTKGSSTEMALLAMWLLLQQSWPRCEQSICTHVTMIFWCRTDDGGISDIMVLL